MAFQRSIRSLHSFVGVLVDCIISELKCNSRLKPPERLPWSTEKQSDDITGATPTILYGFDKLRQIHQSIVWHSFNNGSLPHIAIEHIRGEPQRNNDIVGLDVAIGANSHIKTTITNENETKSNRSNNRAITTPTLPCVPQFQVTTQLVTSI
jgi:hypothetical protein